MMAGAAAVTLFLLFVSSERGGRHLCALAEATLRDISKQPVSIDHCQIEPMPPGVRIDGVRIGASDAPLVAVDSIAAGLAVRGLLRGRLRVHGVKVVRPRVNLDFSNVTPSASPPTARPSCLPDMGTLEIGNLDLQAGHFHLVLPAGRTIVASGLDVAVRGRGALVELGISAGESTFETPDERFVAERLRLRGSIDLARGNATIENLDLTAAEASVFASGVFADVCAGTGLAQATVKLDLEAASHTFLARFPDLGGQVSMQLSAQRDAERWSVSSEGRSESARAARFGPLDADWSVVAQPESLRIERLNVALPSGHLNAQGSLALQAPYEADVEARMERVVLGELLERLGVDDLTVHLEASGRARLKGPLVGANGPRLAGDLDWQVREFGVFDDTWRRRAQAANRWVGISSGSVKSAIVLESDRLTLSDTQITTDESRVRVDGTVFFDVPRGLDLVVEAPRLLLEDLGPFGPVPIKGLGTLSGTVKGDYTGLDIRATASMKDLDVMGLDLGTMSADARLDLDADTLVVTRMKALKGRSPYSGSGKMWFSDGAPMVARIDLPEAYLGDVATVANGLVPSIRQFTGNMDARLMGELTAHGPAAHLNVDATLALSEVSIWEQKFDRGWVEASMVDGARVDIQTLDLERGSGHVQGAGSWTFISSAFDVQINSKNLRAQDVDALLQRWPEMTGGIELSAEASGTLASPRGSATATLRDWWLGDQPIATAQISSRLARSRMTLDGVIVSPSAANPTEPAPDPDAPVMAPAKSMRHVLRADLLIDEDWPWSANASFHVPDASVLLPPDTLAGVFASARGTLTAQGLLSQPSSAKAQIALNELRVEKGRARFTNIGPGEAEFVDGRLFLHQLPLRGSGTTLDARGVRDTDGTLAFEFSGSAELDVLEEFVPTLDYARGHVDLALQLRGTLSDPEVLGEAHFDDVRLTPEGGLVTFSNGQGSIVFSPEAIGIDAVTAKLNGGDFEASGHVSLDHFNPKAVDLIVSLTEVPMRLSDVSLRMSGTPTLRGPLEALHLGGDLDLTWLRFTEDLELERTFIQALELARRPPAPKVFERRGEFLTLDVGVHLGDVRVENNLAQTGFAGDLRLVGTNRRPGILGAVTLTDGRAFIRNVEYRLTSGVVNFTDPTRIRPTFDVRADAAVREYLVRVAASGTAQQPRLLLASEPTLPYADIVTLLTLGVTNRDLERTDSTSGLALLLDAAYNAGFLGLNDQVKRLLPRNEILRDATFRVTSAYSELTGNVEPVAQFESKFLTDDMKLKGQTSLMGSRGSRAQVEYEFDAGLSVQGQVDSNDPNTPSGFDIGGDVIFKKEWQ